MAFTKDQLDTLEDLYIRQLLDESGAVPSAKLDIIRKTLEKNNRLYVKPQPRDCSETLDKASAELAEEAGLDAPMKLPFKVVK